MLAFDVEKVGGIGKYEKVEERNENGEVTRVLYKATNEKVFLVLNKNTLELRSDEKLSRLLIEQYESVMESRYFGRGGIEIVNSGQLEGDEINDLVRLSYNLTLEK